MTSATTAPPAQSPPANTAAAAPRVSVLMPAYNARRYLAEAIDSILGQTFRDFELIVVDDGSTDDTLAILNRYATADPRVRVVSRPNTGISGALNDGLNICRAQLVARMDADDVAEPDRLERQVAYMDAHADCVLLGSNVLLIDPAGLPIGVDQNEPTHEEIERQLLRGRGGAVYHPSAMMRRDAVDRVGRYRPQFNDSEDLDLFLRLAEIGRVANLPEPLLRYRRHLNSVTQNRYQNQWRLKRQIVAEAYQRRGQPMPAGWTFEPWQPRPLAAQLREWGWRALKAGNARAARHQALLAVRHGPMQPKSWQLLYCALRGR
jgi:glycosyltransferase involved in cell wall biosynthesis